jgi:probable rRNA maturation factor
MDSVAVQLEASADIDVPPRSWTAILAAAAGIASELFPSGTVALRVSTDLAIRRLNLDYRGVDAATDVLSFPAGPGAARGHHGDIALSWDAVLRQSGANRNTPEAEAAALLAHALLHLAGYDHPTPETQEVMDIRTRELCLCAGYEVDSFGH